MSRGQRWAVISGGGIAVFALTWWFVEAGLGLDRSSAQAFAGLAVALVSVPAGWWFALAPSPARSAVDSRSAADTAPAVDTRPRSRWAAVLTVVIVLAVGIGGATLWRNADRSGSGGTGDGGSGDGPPSAQSVTVNRTVWYEGIRITVGSVSYDLFFFDVSLNVDSQFVEGQTIKRIYVDFSVPQPAAGHYILLVIDAHGEELPGPGNTYPVPITI